MVEKEYTFASAAANFFGRHPDQKISEFLQELKELTPDDRKELTKLLREEGYNIK